jgi:hypothetical protein
VVSDWLSSLPSELGSEQEIPYRTPDLRGAVAETHATVVATAPSTQGSQQPAASSQNQQRRQRTEPGSGAVTGDGLMLPVLSLLKNRRCRILGKKRLSSTIRPARVRGLLQNPNTEYIQCLQYVHRERHLSPPRWDKTTSSLAFLFLHHDAIPPQLHCIADRTFEPPVT